MDIKLNCISSNFHEVCVNNTILWFSYNTLIAFRKPKIGTVCCENIYGSTTGKHINTIEPNKKKRISYDLFEKISESLEITVDIDKLMGIKTK